MKNLLLTSLLLVSFYTEAKPKKQHNEQKNKPSGAAVITLGENNYSQALSADLAVVMVSAEFCKYCSGMKPIFDAVAQSLADSSVQFYLLDFGKSFLLSDISPVVKRLEKERSVTIKALPQFFIFKKGVLVPEECIGTKTQEQLFEIIQKQLA